MHTSHVVALLAVFTLAACGGANTSEPEGSSATGPSSSSSASSSPSSPVPTDGDTVNGPVPVNGHALFAKCAGTGSPTVVFLHGANPELEPTDYSEAIADELDGEFRFCAYDRRGVGRSDDVRGVQSIEDVLSDLDGVLKSVDAEPPYVLLGASFGGLIAYIYANQHPDDVAGIVALDSPFPDELSLEPLIAPGDRYKAFSAEDELGTAERLSHYKVYLRANEYVGKEPKIPLTYLAAAHERWDEFGVPAYDAKIYPAMKAYVARFSPGRFEWVEAPHFMEQVIPEEIAVAVRQVVADAG